MLAGRAGLTSLANPRRPARATRFPGVKLGVLTMRNQFQFQHRDWYTSLGHGGVESLLRVPLLQLYDETFAFGSADGLGMCIHSIRSIEDEIFHDV